MPSGSPSYVERAADRELYESLLQGEFCYVLNSRQMGKSSLAVRTIAKLSEARVRTAFVDLTRLGATGADPERWYAGLLAEIGRALDLRAEAMAFLRANPELPATTRIFAFLREVALPQIETPVVLMIDEIDAVRSLPFSPDDLFAGFRELWNGRASEPILNQLTVCLLGAALPSDLIQDPRRTPFNVGRRIELRDFTPEEAQPFAAVLGSESRLNEVLAWTGGHPFLTQALCAKLASLTGDHPESVGKLVKSRYLDARARETDTNLADVGNRLLGNGDPDVSDSRRADTLAVYDALLRGRPVADDEANPSAARIKMSGVARIENGLLKPRNRIYRQAFDRTWVRQNMPGQERRRQRKAFWKGVARAAAIALFVIGVVSYLAIDNARQRDAAQYEAYAASMAGANAIADQHSLELLEDVVNRYRSSPYRGWEWKYWKSVVDAPVETVRLGDDGYREGRFAVSSDGRMAVAGHASQMFVTIARLGGRGETRKLTLLPPEKGGPVNGPAPAFFDGGRKVAVSSGSGRLETFDAASGHRLRTILAPGTDVTARPNAVADDRVLLAFRDRSLVGIDLRTGEIETLIHLPKGDRTRPSRTEDGRFVSWLENTDDRTEAVVYDLAAKKELRRVRTAPAWFTPAWAAHAWRLAFVEPSGASAAFLDIRTGRVRVLSPLDSPSLALLELSPDGRYLVASGWKKDCRIYDLNSRSSDPVASLPEAQGCRFAKSGALLVTRSNDIRVFDFKSVLAAQVHPKIEGAFGLTDQGVAWGIKEGRFSSRNLLTGKTTTYPTLLPEPSQTFGSDDCSVALLKFGKAGQRPLVVDVPSGRVLARLEHVTGNLEFFAGSGSGRTCAFDIDRNTVGIASLAGLPKVRRVAVPEGVETLSMSTSGRWLAICDWSGQVRMVETASGEEAWSVRRSWGGRVNQVVFDESSGLVLVGGYRETAEVWSLKDGSPRGPLMKGSQTVLSLDWSPDRKRVVTCDYNGFVRVWDPKTGRCLTTLKGAGNVLGVRFLRDGSGIAGLEGGGQSYMWTVKPRHREEAADG